MQSLADWKSNFYFYQRIVLKYELQNLSSICDPFYLFFNVKIT